MSHCHVVYLQKVKTSFCTVFFVLFSVLFAQNIYAQTPGTGNILFVDGSVATSGDGSSWASVIKELADVLKWAKQQNNFTAENPLKIYVAKGTYKPLYDAADRQFATNGNRDNAFVMVNNVQLYGGFDPVSGIDDLTDTRNYTNTILSGEIGNTWASDNTFHVVISSGAVGSAKLDGFTVTKAYSASFEDETISVNDNLIARYTGGGMLNHNSSPEVSNCSFTANSTNYGGGMYNRSSSPAITNCSFTANTAYGGGGVYNSSFSGTITNCSFTGNSASNGGGMYTILSTPTITNCSFTRNTAIDGGGMNNRESSPTIINTTIANNGSTGFYINGSTAKPVLQNTIVWDDVIMASSGSYTANYSLIKGVNPTTGTGNIDATSLAADAVFADYTGGDYTLKTGSPAINKGSNALYPGLDANTKDLAGNSRLIGPDIDMGAYENPGVALPVRWISFEGRLSDQRRAVLTWKTEETNVSHYEMQRSADARQFRIITTVAAGITGSGTYSLPDPAPVYGTVYYRIRQIDFDGTLSYSPIISVTSGASHELFAYPNPAKNNVVVVLGAEYIGSKVKLISTAGGVLQQTEVKEAALPLDLSGYAAGVYLLQTHDGKVVKLIRD